MAQGDTKTRTDSRDDELNPGRQWKPDGWDADNSGYDPDDPSSKSDRSGSELPPPSADQAPSNAWAPPDPKSLEQNASVNDGQSTASNDKEKSLYNPKKKSSKNKKRWLNASYRGKIAFGLGGGALLMGFFILYPVIQGPFKLINLSQFLQISHFFNNEEFGQERSGLFTIAYRYALTDTAQGTRLGAIQGRNADKWDLRMQEKVGVRPVYNKTSGRLAGYEVYDEAKASSFLQDLDRDNVTRAGPINNEEFTVGRKGGEAPRNRIVALDIEDRGRIDSKKARAANKRATKAVGLNRISTWLGSRVLGKLGAVNFSSKNSTTRKIGDKYADWKRQRDIDRNNYARNGSTPITTKALDGQEVEDEDGKKSKDPQSQQYANEGNDLKNEGLNSDTPESRRAFTSKLRSSFFKVGGGAAAAVGILCVAKDLGNESEKYQYTQIVLPLIRIAYEFVSAGGQIQAGSAIWDEIRYLVDLLTDEDGVSYAASAADQHERGVEVTEPDIKSAIKPDSIEGKPLFFAAIDQIPLLGTACGVLNSIGKIPIIGSAINAVSSVATSIADAGLENTVGVTTEDIIDSTVAWISGEVVDVLGASAPELGNYLHYGSRLGANTSNPFGRELTDSEELILQNDKERILAQEKSQRSIFDKYFDAYDRDSLLAKVIGNESPKAGTMLAGLFNAVPKLATSYISTPASAQTNNEFDYGFPEIGFSLEERESDIMIDPFENADYVEKNLESLVDEFGDCYPIKIDPNTKKLNVLTFNDPNIVHQFNQPDKCTESGGTLGVSTDGEVLADITKAEKHLRFRTYMHDLKNAVALDCYEGENSSCAELGIVSNSVPEAPSIPPGSTDFVWPLPASNNVTACWNDDRTGHRAGYFHSGLDISAADGTDIIAANSGVVKLAGDYSNGTGVTVVIEHGEGLFTQYQHIKTGSLVVGIGDTVTKGQKIAEVNNTGFSSGSHLHFNVQRFGEIKTNARDTLNPLDYLPEDGRNMTGVRSGSFPPPELRGKSRTCVPSSVDVQGWVLN